MLGQITSKLSLYYFNEKINTNKLMNGRMKERMKE